MPDKSYLNHMLLPHILAHRYSCHCQMFHHFYKMLEDTTEDNINLRIRLMCTLCIGILGHQTQYFFQVTITGDLSGFYVETIGSN